MKYLIGIDLDGTLLTSNKTINNYTKEAINKVIDKGHIVVLATGRSYLGTINHYESLGLNTPMITLHGGVVSFMNDKTFSHKINSNLIYDLYNNLNDYIITAVYNTPDKIYSFNHSEELELVFNGAVNKERHSFDINNISEEIVNIAVAVKGDKTNEFEKYFKDKDLVARSWGENNNIAFYDIHLKNVSKASALKEVLNHFNINEDNLITFGDGPNDIEMLKMAKIGVAMQNAGLEAKAFADETTKHDNDNDGVGYHLNYLIEKNIL